MTKESDHKEFVQKNQTNQQRTAMTPNHCEMGESDFKNCHAVVFKMQVFNKKLDMQRNKNCGPHIGWKQLGALYKIQTL